MVYKSVDHGKLWSICFLQQHLFFYEKPILGDPGADSGGERKSKRAENMAQRKVKKGEKSPWEQCLTRPVPNRRRRSDFGWCQKTFARLAFPSPLLSAPGSPRMQKTKNQRSIFLVK